jgi:nucleoside-diphosphate-sugar epimerase
MRVLITGASGFIGGALTDSLARQGISVRAAARRAPANLNHRAARAEAPNKGERGAIERMIVGDLGRDTDWRGALAGVDAVVHLAGPAHARFSAAQLRRAIVEATRSLAEQAASAGVSRFIFISSLKASARAPDGYGIAKRDAERALLAHAKLRPVALRPPLVFAPDAKASFAQLMRLADTPAPLPFAGIANARSLISRASLLEAITAVLRQPDGPSGVFELADAPALSTPAIIAALRRGLGRPARLIRVPGIALIAPTALTQTLVADASAFMQVYGWRGVDAAAALEACAADWKAQR